MWCKGRISGGFWKKKAIGWLWKRYLATFIIELIPFFNIIPTNVIFVLMAHYKEKKMVKLFNAALETFFSPDKFDFKTEKN